MSAETNNEQGSPVFLKEILQVLEEEKPVFEGLLKFADQENKLEEEQIELARRQTSLTSDLVKNSALRTDLAAESTELNKQLVKNSDLRTQLAEKRTEMSAQRMELDKQLVKNSDLRTQLAEKRTEMSANLVDTSNKRTELAEQRTHTGRCAYKIDAGSDQTIAQKY